MVTKEQSKAVKEQSKTTSEEKQVKETSKADEETSKETYTKDEVALIKKEGEDRLTGLQSTKDTEVAEALKRFTKAEGEAKTTNDRLQVMETELEEVRTARYKAQEDLAEASDDPAQAKKAIQMLRQAEVREAELNKREFKLKQDQTEMYTYARQKRAEELNREYGIPIVDVLTAEKDGDMVNKALMYALGKKEAPETKESEKETPQPDAGTNTSGGKQRSFSREELANMSIEDYEKIKPEVDKARREGRIKD